MCKVIQVVPSIGAESSGPSYSVPAMCRGLQSAGCEVSLHFVGTMPKRRFRFPVFAYKAHRFPHSALGRSPEMLSALQRECNSAQIIHNNSLWMMPNIYPAIAKRGTNCKLVMQPRGTLSEYALSRSKWKKRLIGWCGQYAALRAADMWVATAESEYEDIRRAGYAQPVAILPNGIDLPTDDIVGRNVKGCGGRRRMFFLSRIHPKKNVEMLLRCWAGLEGKFPDWELSIVGPDKNNAYADNMKVLAKRLGCCHVRFEGEINGGAKYKFMAESDCEILPTHSENFGMVVAESLACGTPVICSHGAPWSGLDLNGCGWWIPTSESDFRHCMSNVMRMPREALAEMGMNGREWMARDFSWDAIGHEMALAYKWLCEGGEKPSCVRID